MDAQRTTPAVKWFATIFFQTATAPALSAKEITTKAQRARSQYRERTDFIPNTSLSPKVQQKNNAS